jgi:hypothetical protein
MRQSFKLLRTRPEPLPTRLEAKVKATLGAPASLRFENPQYTRSPGGGIWVASAGASTCVIEASHGAVSCNATAKVARRGLMLGVYRVAADRKPRDFLVLGIAPDWARHVRLRVGAAVRVIAVRDNSYAMGARLLR